jgi:hypothetical protein
LKWRTHKLIAREICKDLSLDKDSCSNLEEASVIPDKWRNYPHHSGKEAEISSRIIRARRNWLIKRTDRALEELGIALHYIVDKYSPPHSHPKHDELEGEIAKLDGISVKPSSRPLGKIDTLKIATEKVELTSIIRCDPQQV